MITRKRAFVLGVILVILVGTAVLFLSGGKSQNDILFRENPERGCTVILVGKNASIDGSTMATHSADCGVCDWTWRHIPGSEYESGSKRRIYHKDQLSQWPEEGGMKGDAYKDLYADLEIPQVERTYAYKHSVFGYMNEFQLAMGESTIGNVRKMRNSTPTPRFDITMLTIIAMERCKTAREAIQLMGSLAEEHGYGKVDSGEMLAVHDPKEIWIFEIMPVGPLWTPGSGKPGAVWCAQRVPDDHVSLCPNESRIGEINLDNRDYFMASPNAVSYAVENDLYDPDKGEPFNWKKAYSPSPISAASSRGTRVRLWRFFNIVAPSLNLSPETPNMDLPFSVKPDKKLSLKDVMTITRDKFADTPFDPIRGLQGGPFKNPNHVPRPFQVEDKTYGTARTIGVNRSEYTTVTVCRSWLPDFIGGIIWLSFGAQDTACYMPLYTGMTTVPESFTIGDHFEFDRRSARWAFDYVDFHAQVVYSYAIEDVKKAIEEHEDGAISMTPAIEKTALEMHEKDPARAIQFITDYCLQNANKVVDAWWKLGDDLLVKYNHLSLYDKETRRSSRIQYPEWWLKILVEYDKLIPMAPGR
ncbi:MAG: C69 family dipeptidase [Candidatus Aminicenantes bacterium]|nr:C69 family dipeptidase [Candidatus Aminicenantes bacterium]